jgi:non-ribosomal peptide synthetase component F/thioesterase domain-containing protein/acyl carrier protein
MTAAQLRFWLLDQLNPGNPALNVPLAARLTGKLDRSVMEKAVNEVLRRHEILRTSFRTVDDEVVQVIHPERKITLDWRDISTRPQAEREADINRLMLEEGARSFSLAQGPLLRGGLIKVQDDDHVLLLTLHHIGCDGWSNGIIMREVAQIYSALLTGDGLLPELPLQFADFAQWQNEWLASPAAAEQAGYWKTLLQGKLPILKMPTDRPRTPGRARAGDIQTLLLPRPLQDSILTFCNREGVTPFMLFFAIYATLLHRYTGESDVIIGSPSANRNETDLEGLIGLFSNPLVLRLDLSGNPTFAQLLIRVKELALGAFDHQAYPFEKLLDEIQTNSSHLNSQWLRYYFIFQKAFMLPQEMPGLKMTPLRSISPGAMFEWTLGILERAEGMRLQLEYNTDLFDQSTIERMLRHTERLLQLAVTDPAARIDDVILLTPAERQKMLVDWNTTAIEVPQGCGVHQLIEQYAARNPRTTALCDRKKQISYQDLNAQANKLAHYLRRIGVKNGDRVGLGAEEGSVHFIVGFLAILKAGGCAVVFDPWTENKILECQVSDAGLTALLIEKGFPTLPHPRELRTVSLVQDAGEIEKCDGDNLSEAFSPEQIACVRFTSRPSASPKGAVFNHLALLNGAFGGARELGLTGEDRVGFSLEEMFPALLSGATVVLGFRREKFTPETWVQWVRSQRLTVASLPTALWHEVAHLCGRDGFSPTGNLRVMLVGGDRISPKSLREWKLATGNRVRLLDRYLIAECVGPAAYAEPLADAGSAALLSRFRPAPNTRLYLLDSNFQPVPAGVLGDLYVGGNTVAERPDGPADPYGDGAGPRLIRTGDCGRFLASGAIELLGLGESSDVGNAYRLERAEICSVLSQHPAIWDVLIVAREAEGGAPWVAYALSHSAPPPSAEEIRAFAAEHLPAYMVPSAFVILNAFPVTPRGTVDRARLPAPRSPQSEMEHVNLASGSLLEQKLTNICCEVLGLKEMGPHENFFELGGDSLLAFRLVSRIKRELNFNLPAHVVFQRPTIAELVGVLSDKKAPQQNRELIPLETGSSGPTLVLLIGAGSFEMFSLAQLLRENANLYVSTSPLPEAVLKAATAKRVSGLPSMEEMAAGHVESIRALNAAKPVLLTGFCFAGVLAFEVARQLQQEGTPVAGVVLLDAWMYRPSFWWRQWTYFRRHLESALQSGPAYVMRKLRSRVKFEKYMAEAERRLVNSGDFGGEVPWVVAERIYKHAMVNYKPRPLSCRGVVITPRDDWTVQCYRPTDETLGAQGLFAGKVNVIEAPGNHVNILTRPNLPELALRYKDALARLREPDSLDIQAQTRGRSANSLAASMERPLSR